MAILVQIVCQKDAMLSAPQCGPTAQAARSARRITAWSCNGGTGVLRWRMSMSICSPKADATTVTRKRCGRNSSRCPLAGVIELIIERKQDGNTLI